MRSFPDTPFFRRKVCHRTFLIRKVGKRISHRIYHFILVKFLRFQGTFYKKSLGQGLGQKPQLITNTKTRHCRVFVIAIICWNCRSKPCFKGLFVKSPLKIRKNFPPNTPIYFGEAFEIPKDFSRKVLCVGVWGKSPN